MERLDLTAQGNSGTDSRLYRDGHRDRAVRALRRTPEGNRQHRDPHLLEQILAHRRDRAEEGAPTGVLAARAPPQASLF